MECRGLRLVENSQAGPTIAIHYRPSLCLFDMHQRSAGSDVPRTGVLQGRDRLRWSGSGIPTQSRIVMLCILHQISAQRASSSWTCESSSLQISERCRKARCTLRRAGSSGRLCPNRPKAFRPLTTQWCFLSKQLLQDVLHNTRLGWPLFSP